MKLVIGWSPERLRAQITKDKNKVLFGKEVTDLRFDFESRHAAKGNRELGVGLNQHQRMEKNHEWQSVNVQSVRVRLEKRKIDKTSLHTIRKLRSREIGSYRVIERGISRCFLCGAHLAMTDTQATNCIVNLVTRHQFKNGCVDCSFNKFSSYGLLSGFEFAAMENFWWWYSRGEPRDFDDWGKIGDGVVRNFYKGIEIIYCD